MTTTPATAEDVPPITDRLHDTSWSANLEQPYHGADRDLLVQQALDAVAFTLPGNHVNLVTHADHGAPEYLYTALEGAFDDEIDYEYVDQCGCGGHVVRVHVHD